MLTQDEVRDMYGKNVGETLKSMAAVICGFFIAAGVIAGIGMAVSTESFFTFILVVLAGTIVGWLSSVMLYAFGDLVSNTQQIQECMTSLRGEVMQLRDDVDYLCNVKEAEVKLANRERREVLEDKSLL